MKLHSKHLIKRIISMALALSILATIGFFPYGVALKAIADTQDEYDKVNAELEKLRESQGQLDSEFTSLNTKLNSTGQKLSELEVQISEKQTAITDISFEIADMQVKIDAQYENMKLRIQFMYENGTDSFLSNILSAKDMSDLLAKAEYVRKISDYDHDKMAELSDLLKRQEDAKETLVAEYNELLSLKASAEKESANLSALMSDVQTKINTNSKDIEEAEALALAYEKKIQQELLKKQMEEIAAGNVDGVDGNSLAQVLANHTAEDVAMLAAIIECEAGNQPYEGMLAVGSVVMNRVANPRFADSLEGVLYAPYQFSPVASGRFAIVLSRGATDICTQAAIDVLNGNINIDAHYFHGYNPAVDHGGTVIGDHVFY